MISLTDIEARVSGEFEVDEKSYWVSKDPLSRPVSEALGLEDCHAATHIVRERYRGSSDLLGLYEDMSGHYWEARKVDGKYLLVHVGDWADYLHLVDSESLWICEGLEIGGDYFDAHGGDSRPQGGGESRRYQVHLRPNPVAPSTALDTGNPRGQEQNNPRLTLGIRPPKGGTGRSSIPIPVFGLTGAVVKASQTPPWC